MDFCILFFITGYVFFYQNNTVDFQTDLDLICI